MEFFKPEFYFKHYSDISVEWLKENDIQLILSDIDSTLAPHNKLGNSSLNTWLEKLKKEKIEVVCVSNNTDERAKVFGEKYNLISIGKCGKPQIYKIEQLLKEKQANKENTVLMGDQLFTDVWSGKRLGVKTILVAPIGEQQPIGIKIKRIIENKWIRKWGFQ